MTRSLRFTSSALLLASTVFAALLVPVDCGAIEIVRQPGPAGKDSYVTDMFGWANNNFGDYEDFQIMGFVTQSAAYIEFDISAIPAGSTINWATLTLYADYLDGTIYFAPVVAPWEESTITWNNRPSNLDPTLSYPISRGDPSGPCYWGCALAFDITDIVQVWVDQFNYGVRVIADTGYVSFMMASGDNMSHPRPMLTIDYTEPLGVEESTWGAIKMLYR
jgi:hypothetical protein